MLDFPLSPVTGTSYTTSTNGVAISYVYDGVKWTGASNFTAVTPYVLPTASTSTLGGVIVDGTTVTIDGGGVISAAPPAPTVVTRVSVSTSTQSLTNGSSESTNINHTGLKAYALFSVTVNQGAWVRLYTSSAARTADSGRLQTVDPTPGSGVLAEVVTSASTTVLISPSIVGFTSENLSSIPLAVTNLGATGAVTVTLSLLPLEG